MTCKLLQHFKFISSSLPTALCLTNSITELHRLLFFYSRNTYVHSVPLKHTLLILFFFIRVSSVCTHSVHLWNNCCSRNSIVVNKMLTKKQHKYLQTRIGIFILVFLIILTICVCTRRVYVSLEIHHKKIYPLLQYFLREYNGITL